MINFVESMNSQLFKHLFKHIRFLRVKVLEAPNPKYCENFVDSSNLYQAPDNICDGYVSPMAWRICSRLSHATVSQIVLKMLQEID